MDDTRLMHWLVTLHAGLSRLGPGQDTATRRALAACVERARTPDILEVGCGTGAATLVLAESSAGRLIAVDRVPTFLADLRRRAAAVGLDGRIHTVLADMRALPFAPSSFDLIWSEGAIYIMGFDAGLNAWRPLLRPRGFLAVTELSWLTVSPLSALATYWNEDYPAMRTVAGNLDACRELGWEIIAHDPLPHAAWMRDYYGPLRTRLPAFRADHADDPEAQAVVDMTEAEMELMADADGVCSYVFYVLRRTD